MRAITEDQKWDRLSEGYEASMLTYYGSMYAEITSLMKSIPLGRIFIERDNVLKLVPKRWGLDERF